MSEPKGDPIGIPSFLHIPKALTLQFLGELLTKANATDGEITEFFEVLNTCWTPNFCKFNNDFYKFSDEVSIPIGFPLGSLISEIYM